MEEVKATVSSTEQPKSAPKAESKVTANKEDQQAPVSQDTAEPAKAEKTVEAEKKESQAQPQQVVWNIDDISSPSNEVFWLKSGSKRVQQIAGDMLDKLGLPRNDKTKFKGSNNYIDHVKYLIMKMIQEGKFGENVRWTGHPQKFAKVDPIPPEPKQKKARASKKQADIPMPDLLNLFQDAQAK